jgi:acetyl-CoA carboxylase carboxyltransferase component
VTEQPGSDEPAQALTIASGSDSAPVDPAISSAIEKVEQRRVTISDAGRADAVQQQHARGKRTARERVDALLDAGSFRENGRLVLATDRTRDALSLTDDEDYARATSADGIVVGTGTIGGRRVSTGAFDFTVLGGSNGEYGAMKLNRQGQIALEDGHPLIVMFDGGGHRIQEGLEAWTFEAGGGIMPIEVAMSGWAPMIAGLVGPSWGGIVNFAALMDFVIMVESIGSAGLAGPALVKAALGESITKEELGGPKMQARQVGLVDLVVPDEDAFVSTVHKLLSYLPSNSALAPPIDPHWSAPAGASEGAIEALLPTTARQAYDVRGILRLIFDEGSLFEIRPTFARNAVTAFARIEGRPVGVIANQSRHLAGSIDAKACEKLTHFVSICDAYGLPITSFIDVPGFMIGSRAEQSGVARKASRLVWEMARLTVPLLSVVIRKGYGMGYQAMGGGRVFEPATCVAWPSAEVAAMSVPGAVDTLYRDPVPEGVDANELRDHRIAELSRKTGALAAAATFAVDDVILPSETRSHLLDTLARTPARRERIRRGHRPVAPI